MSEERRGAGQLFRLWIVAYDDWQPKHCHDMPPAAVALEPVEQGPVSAAEAALFVEGFNLAMLAELRSVWAVAVPVTVRLEGDARAGAPIDPRALGAWRPALESTGQIAAGAMEPLDGRCFSAESQARLGGGAAG